MTVFTAAGANTDGIDILALGWFDLDGNPSQAGYQTNSNVVVSVQDPDILEVFFADGSIDEYQGLNLVYATVAGVSAPSGGVFTQFTKTLASGDVVEYSDFEISVAEFNLFVVDQPTDNIAFLEQLAFVGNDRLTGSALGDRLVAFAGNDTVNGALGNDTIFGEAGDDELDGGEANDELYGGLGDDLIVGGNGDDFISGDVSIDLSGF